MSNKARTTKHFLASLSIFFLIFSLTSGSSYGSNNSDQARNEAKKILSQKKFSKSQNNAPLSGDVKRISDWLGGAKNKPTKQQIPQKQKAQNLQNQNKSSGLSLPDLSIIGYIVLIILIAAAVGLITWGIYKAALGRNKKAKEKNNDLEIDDIDDIEWDDEEKVLTQIDDVDILEKLAEKAASESRFDIALRYRFRAGLLRLDKINLIRFHPSTTNNSYEIALNNIVFTGLINSFNDVTYGEIACNQIDYENAKKSWALLLAKPSAPKASAQMNLGGE